MEPENLQELTNNISPDTLEAMNEFTKRLLGTNDTAELATTTSEITNTELSRMMYWVMVVGYSLRTMEVKFELENNLATRASPEGGPKGGIDFHDNQTEEACSEQYLWLLTRMHVVNLQLCSPNSGILCAKASLSRYVRE